MDLRLTKLSKVSESFTSIATLGIVKIQNLFLNINVIVYPLSTMTLNPYSSIHSAMVISHDTVNYHVLFIGHNATINTGYT